jgi:hypothetical protein
MDLNPAPSGFNAGARIARFGAEKEPNMADISVTLVPCLQDNYA